MDTKEKSIILEFIATLYLRLNGYFTTGFIIHSDDNNIDAELDILAIRFPRHKQNYTTHNSSDFLEVPNNIDIIVAEVKAKGQSLQFNDSLKQQADFEPWQKILDWTGLLEDEQVSSISKELNSLVQPIENSQRKSFLSTQVITTSFGNLTIRPIMFSPERPNCNNADKFINWTEVNDFIWSCLCPSEKREACGTRYDFTSWGHGLTEVVKAYKDRQKTQVKFQTIDELYNDITKNREPKEKVVQI
ncbi:MAG: hypothetical protein IT220_09750 [Flavobacteriaceae bacterium]|nr:hypothetical protein [Flavobacteriaceae bacterium]